MLNHFRGQITFGVTIGVVMTAVFLTKPVSAQEIHASLCMHGCPSGSPATNDIVIRDIYILSSSDITKFADWVSYRITRSTIGKTQTRVWKQDPWLADNETLEPKDYYGAFDILKTDRGHQAPLASFTSTSNWEVTNYLSNITPQKSALNQGAWARLEDAVRTLAKMPETDAVFVMTGPLFERKMPVMPGADESHLVPSGYWKIITRERDGVIKIASFLFDQETERTADFCDAKFTTNVRMIERKTSLNFFHALPWTKQDELENGPATLLSDLGCRR